MGASLKELKRGGMEREILRERGIKREKELKGKKGRDKKGRERQR